MSKIVLFEWDYGKDEEYNGKTLIIGKSIPKNIYTFNDNNINIQGFALDIIDIFKSDKFKNLSLSSKNVNGKINEVSKLQARNILINEIDNILNLLYTQEIQYIDNIKKGGIDQYFKDLKKWENSFYCNECDLDNINNFAYERTCANSDIFICKGCNNTILPGIKPNEDNY